MSGHLMRKSPRIHWFRILIAFALLAGCLWFIWSNSLLSSNESSRRSEAVAEFLAKMLGQVFGQGSRVVQYVRQHVRKIAHAVEFCMLGLVSGLILVVLGRVNIHTALHAILLVLSAAVADEAIQIYSHRGAQVQDVLLDFAGGMAGLFAMLALYKLLRTFSGKPRSAR